MLKKLTNKIIIAVVPALGAALIRFIGFTMRITRINIEAYDKLAAKGQNVIFAFWHGRLMMMPYLYHGKGATILISRHRDGELVARAIKGFGIAAERGSTTRGGATAMLALIKAGRAGRDLVITPDGPKGPRFKAQMGALQLARLSGLPILPVAFGASKKKLSTVGIAL